MQKTPDGRYLVINGRLWRATNPNIDEDQRKNLVSNLMAARRAVKKALQAKDANGLILARRKVHAAKVSLGERGPVWWTDGAPDYNRHLLKNTPYASKKEEF